MWSWRTDPLLFCYFADGPARAPSQQFVLDVARRFAHGKSIEKIAESVGPRDLVEHCLRLAMRFDEWRVCPACQTAAPVECARHGYPGALAA